MQEKCTIPSRGSSSQGRLSALKRTLGFFPSVTECSGSFDAGKSTILKGFETHAITGDQSYEICQSSSQVDILDLDRNFLLVVLDPATAKLAIPFIGPFLSAFSFLFIVRIVMSWYPKLPVGKFPYVLAYAPTEPILVPTRKVIPPVGGVDITPVVWFGLLSFLNEILVGPQGLLVLISQQI
ncbi:hypothetical protein Dimus_010008 [Dionaea muscipula]